MNKDELERFLKNNFSWLVGNLNYLLTHNGVEEATRAVINELWTQYYSKKPLPLLSRTEIVSWIGELENLLSKYREEV